MILDGLLEVPAALECPDSAALTDTDEARRLRLRTLLRRRLERMREPTVWHPIQPIVPVGVPDAEAAETLAQPDSAQRAARRVEFQRNLRHRLATLQPPAGLPPDAPNVPPPPGMRAPGGSNRPDAYAGRRPTRSQPAGTPSQPVDAPPPLPAPPDALGDSDATSPLQTDVAAPLRGAMVPPEAGATAPPTGDLPPTAVMAAPADSTQTGLEATTPPVPDGVMAPPDQTVSAGDSLAARARRLRRDRED